MNTFAFAGQQLRTIDIDGTPWFHATDVCKCIGLTTRGGTYPHLMKLDVDEKRSIKRTPNPIMGAPEFLGTAPSATAVNESGLYKLTLRADGAKAKPFQDWVTRDVLPAIRRTGAAAVRRQTDI